MAQRKWDFDNPDGNALYQEIKRAQAVAIQEITQDIHQARNRGFKQVYPKAWHRMKSLAQRHQTTTPLLVYTTLCEFSGRTSAVVASHSTLAQVLGVSTKSINRACDLLVEARIVRRFRTSKGGAYCYCLNPDEVWGGLRGDREIAPFHTMTIVSWGDQDEAIRAMIPTLLPPHASARDPKAKQKAGADQAIGIDAKGGPESDDRQMDIEDWLAIGKTGPKAGDQRSERPANTAKEAA